MGLRVFRGLVFGFIDFESDFRPLPAGPKGTDIFDGGGGVQLPAHPSGNRAGRLYHHRVAARFRPRIVRGRPMRPGNATVPLKI